MKFKKILRSKYLYYLFVSLLFFFLFCFDLKNKNNIYNINVYLFFLLFSLIIIFIIFMFIKKMQKLELDSYYKYYVVVSLIFGMILVFLCPPFMGSDEKTHFFRAYEISKGHFITTLGENGILATMPSSLYNAYTVSTCNGILSYHQITDVMDISLENEKQIAYCNCNDSNYLGASLYSPLQYVPHMIGIFLGRILKMSPVWILNLGRIFNLLGCILLTTIGLKIIPKNKLFTMLVALSPVVMIGQTTFSADGFTNAIIFLFIAYILKLINSKKILKLKDKVILSILTIFIATCKIVYLPIIFLIILIPKESFKDKKDNIISKFLIINISLLIGLLWIYFASSLLHSVSDASTMQKDFIFNNFIEYIFITFRTYVDNFNMIISNLFVGNQLYHGRLRIYSIFPIVFLVVIILSIFNEKRDFKINNQKKILVLIIILLILGLTSTALYIQHTSQTKIGYEVVTGLQGRYFIPVCFLLTFLIEYERKFIKDKVLLEIFLLLYIPIFMTIVVLFI